MWLPFLMMKVCEQPLLNIRRYHVCEGAGSQLLYIKISKTLKMY